MLMLSTAPTWAGDSIAPRHLDMRPFVLQSKSLYVTTGGLTRVAMREGSLVVNSSQGGGSKDTWIVRGDLNMLSRAAESLYWMARYLERAENTARLINATQQLLLDLPPGAYFGWDALTRIVGLDKLFQQNYTAPDEASVVDFLMTSQRNPGSIQSCVRFARENCRVMRDVLPRDLWERVNSLFLASRRYSQAGLARKDRRQMLEELIYDRQSVTGVLASCMSHDVAWQFIGLGEHIERADMTTRILDIQSAILLPQQESATRARAAVGGRAQFAVGLADVPPPCGQCRHRRRRHHRRFRVALSDLRSALPALGGLLPRRAGDAPGRAAAQHGSAARAAHRAAPRRSRRPPRTWLAGARHDFLDAIQGDLAQIHDAIAREYFHLHQRETALGVAV